MRKSNGYIRIFRQLVDWEWYDDPNTTRVFIHLLLTVNWKDTKWQGIIIKRGQRVISYQNLAKETSLSVRQVRTAIEHLKSTRELTSEVTNHRQIITVENYSKYQCDDMPSDTSSDTKSVTSATTDEEYKNKELREKPPSGVKREDSLSRGGVPTLEDIRAYCEERHNGIDPEEFYSYYAARGWKMNKGMKMTDWRCAVISWEKRRKNAEPTTDQEKHDQVLAKQQQRLEELKAYKARMIESGASKSDLDTVEMNIVVVEDAVKRMQEARV